MSKKVNRMDRIELQKLAAMDEWFAAKGVFWPRAGFDSDGCVVKLDMRGIKKKDGVPIVV